VSTAARSPARPKSARVAKAAGPDSIPVPKAAPTAAEARQPLSTTRRSAGTPTSIPHALDRVRTRSMTLIATTAATPAASKRAATAYTLSVRPSASTSRGGAPPPRGLRPRSSSPAPPSVPPRARRRPDGCDAARHQPRLDPAPRDIPEGSPPRQLPEPPSPGRSRVPRLTESASADTIRATAASGSETMASEIPNASSLCATRPAETWLCRHAPKGRRDCCRPI
jgi:hypothetical protein